MDAPKKELFLGSENHSGSLNIVSAEESLHGNGASTKLGKKLDIESSPLLSTDITFGEKAFIPFGSDNLLPVKLRNIAKNSTVLAGALPKFASMIFGGGPKYGHLVSRHDQEFLHTDYKAESTQKFRKFFRYTHADQYAISMANNISFYGTGHPMIYFGSNDKPTIAAVYCTSARKLRWVMPNKKGEITEAGLSSDWQTHSRYDDKEIEKVPVINLDHNIIDNIGRLHKAKKSKFILRNDLVENMYGDDYYPRPSWISSVLSGWLDHSLQIPKVKNLLLNEILNLKYIVYVDTSYWQLQYPKEWRTWSPDKKLEIKKKEVADFLKKLKGGNNTAGAIMAAKTTSHDGRVNKLWEVEELGKNYNSEGKGHLLEDSAEASNHILYSISMDPTITGAGPGRNHNSGSGSDKRVASNLQISLMKPVQDYINKPFEIKRDLENIDDDLVFRMRNTIQQTLDKGKSQQETS